MVLLCTAELPRRSFICKPSNTLAHICTGAGLTAATSTLGLGSPMPHLHRDSAHPYHICTGTALGLATSAPGLRSALPHLHRDSARPCHICTGTALGLAAPIPLCDEFRSVRRSACIYACVAVAARHAFEGALSARRTPAPSASCYFPCKACNVQRSERNARHARCHAGRLLPMGRHSAGRSPSP